MDVRRSVRGGRNRHVRQRRRGGGGGNGGKVVVVHARNGVNGNEGSGKAEMGVRRQNLARRRGEVTTTTSAVMVAREASEETKIKRKEVKKREGDMKLRDAVRLGVEGDALEDEPVHWATLGIAGALDAALLMQATLLLGEQQQQHYPGSVAAAVVVGFVLADLGTGIFHWSVDNYGGPETPIFGKVIAAFQGHHRQPWSITIRGAANNLYPLAKPSIVFLLGCIALPFGPLTKAFLSSFICFVVLSQHFHRLAHMRPGRVSPLVRTLQKSGLLVSVAEHNAHHRVPFNSNYCIVNGMWNKPLDEVNFFPRLEQVVLSLTGVEPRCWHEPDYEEIEAIRIESSMMSEELSE